MHDLSVEVRCQDIIVTKPGTGLCVTYRRATHEPTLLCSNTERSRCHHTRLFDGGLARRLRQSEKARVALMEVPPPMISIIDDDELVRESTKALVRSLGYAARTFPSVEEFLCSNWDDTNCLILDIQMRGRELGAFDRGRSANADHLCYRPFR